MTQSIPATIQEEIWTRYQRRYGDIIIDFTRFVWEEDDTFTLAFTLRKDDTFIAHYFGKAAYDAGGLMLDIEAIEY